MMKQEDGYSLIEVIVTITVIGILVAALSAEFAGWRSRYKVEDQIKRMYMDFMDARNKALQRNRDFFLTGDASSYTVYEDTNPAPDGNETFESGSDTQQPNFPKEVTYEIDWTGSGNVITIDKRGLISPEGEIYLPTVVADDEIDADYDCIELRTTRINLGKWKNATSQCITK